MTRHRVLASAVALAALLAGACQPQGPRPASLQSSPPLSEAPVTPPAEPLPTEPAGGERQICTMDAKICPDGSAVGRTGPNCTFPACPGG